MRETSVNETICFGSFFILPPSRALSIKFYERVGTFFNNSITVAPLSPKRRKEKDDNACKIQINGYCIKERECKIISGVCSEGLILFYANHRHMQIS